MAANILSFSVKTNLANAAVVCVDKYNYASVIPCSDQNAIAAPAGGNMKGNMTASSGNMKGNMTASSGNMKGNMTLPTTSPPVVASPPLVPTQQQGWMGTCNTLRSLLLQSCSELVNPDGTLSPQGDRAVGCIRNGLIIALGGISQNLPLPVIIGGLKILQNPTGCGNIVNWDQILSIAQLQTFGQLLGR